LLPQAVQRTIGELNEGTVAAFLSGGLDSSTVSGFLSRISPKDAKTFTVGFGHSAYDEVSFARIASSHFMTRHREYYMTPKDVVDLLPRVAKAYDEPFGNSSALPVYCCARAAREDGVELLLAGDGGDEIFAGNMRYVEQLIFEVYTRVPRFVRSRLLEPLIFRLPFGASAQIVRKARGYISRANVPMPSRLEMFNLLSLRPKDEIFEPSFVDAVDVTDPLVQAQDIYAAATSTNTLHRMMHLDMKVTLADNDLRKVNRMCALAQVDVRFPFLDEDLVEFAARVPPSLLIRFFRIRDFYKRALRGFLPDEVLAKQKHGFGMPFADWSKNDPTLKQFVCDNLIAFRRRGFMKSAFIDDLIDRHEPTNSAYDGLKWDAMMLELWLCAHGVG